MVKLSDAASLLRSIEMRAKVIRPSDNTGKTEFMFLKQDASAVPKSSNGRTAKQVDDFNI